MTRRQYPCAARARAQIIRRDLPGYDRYRTELNLRHYRPRAVIGFTTAYAVADERHTWGQLSGKEFGERFRRAFLGEAKAADWTADYVAQQPRRQDIVDKAMGRQDIPTTVTYTCACGDVWPDASYGVGHTPSRCYPYPDALPPP
ncbi:hypothetical protein AB0F46_01760 [Streptomyces sp. NPDC026665]|uniref:hypothetical protein n=1 Tax=Streptomyces sp. NPDC026665 TaxID=3154798 RepID=UPI0033D0A27E